MTATATHPFETAGLGLAPFRFAGMVVQDVAYGEAVIGGRESGCLVTTKRGGSCDYCGTYIVNMYRVRSADGRTFKVGADCAAKVGGKVASEVKRAEKSRRKASKVAAIDALRAELRAAMETATNAAAVDYARFCLDRAGAMGLKRALARLGK